MADTAALLYTAEHEWIAVDGEPAAGSTVTIGITAYAAGQLGDVVYVDLPKVGRAVAAGTVVGEIESTKSVGELYAPVDGEVVEVNDAVVAAPELVNAEPFDGGWLIKVRIAEVPSGLLSADDYAALIAG